ncbi:MAG: hypothetical protein ABSG84_09710 [Acidobacteriaceae bacterium]
MRASRTLFGIAFRAAAFSFLMAGAASLAQARQPSPTPPLFLASETSPASLVPTAPETSQPPPRRYGRPNFSRTTSNPDGSNKYEFLGAVGAGLPVGNTHAYETPNWGFQAGGGRNFNRNFGVILQFDYDHFGLQAATLNHQEVVYNYCPPAVMVANQCPAPIANLDGNNHVWSFTLNPTFTLATQGSWDAYAVVGGGFYHKVTNFLAPTSQEECSIYGCGYYNVDETVAHYTSNAFGVNGGFGLTVKISNFSGAKVYLETRYVLVLNSQRYGYTAQNVATTTYTGFDAYPANSNRTTYIPIKLGIRF